jgi:hypothetical protein
MKNWKSWSLGGALSLFLASCLPPSEEKGLAHQPVIPTSTFFEHTQPFSSAEREDHFLIGYHGASLWDTMILFYIVNPEGDTLYGEEWPSSILNDSSGVKGNDSIRMVEAHEKMREIVRGSGCKLDSPQSQTQPSFCLKIGQMEKRLVWDLATRNVGIR